MVMASLKADPWNYIQRLESPIGFYLRRKALKSATEKDDLLRHGLHEKIVSGQSMDGSWNGIFVYTANNLCDLINLGYGVEDASVKKGAEWLFSIQRSTYRGFPGFFSSGHREDASIMRSTMYGEFGPGCSLWYQTTYAVHLLSRLGFQEDPRVKTTIDSYLKICGVNPPGTHDRIHWCGAWCDLNVLRVLIQHPSSAESTTVEKALEFLEENQTKRGTWEGYSFYHLLHALSRSRLSSAQRQLEKALPTVIKRQNPDGSWGTSQKENQTFLVLDTLSNIGLL